MAFDVTLYTFSKRKSSTAKPTGGTVFSGLMREPCGVIRPSISFEFAAGVNPSAYNYAYIPSFGRYYFINEWTSVGRLWVCSMEVDALASWQDEIGNQSLYVLRSSAAKNNDIIDLLYPAMTSPDIVSEYKDFDSWSYSFSAGSFVVGFISSTESGIGAVTYYGFTNAEFRVFCHSLLSTTEWLNPGGDTITEISNDLLKALFNPFQYIASCIWLPFSVSGTNVNSIPLGWNWGISANAKRMSGNMLYSDYLDFTVPPHPDWETYGTYIHSAPFSEYVLSVPPFGTFPLDANIASQTEDISAEVDVDAVTGVGRLQIRGAGYTFADVTAQVGVPIQLAQSTLNINRATDAVASVAGGAIKGAVKDFTGAIADVASGVVSALSFATSPLLISTGSNGSLAGFGAAKMTGIFYHPTQKSNSLFGSPLCEKRTLSTIPGYIQIADPHVNIAATETERSTIESFMESGFFLENN